MKRFSRSDRPRWSDQILRLARLPWRPVFHKTLDNASAPDGKIDMYLIVSDDSGEGIVSIGCPVGRPDIPAYIADCCSNPWMARPDDGSAMADLAVGFNKTIQKHFAKAGDGMVDAKEITLAAMSIVEAYLRDVPARARVNLVNDISARFSQLRGENL